MRDLVEDGAEDEIDAMFEDFFDDGGAPSSVSSPGRAVATAVHGAASPAGPASPSRLSQDPPVRMDAHEHAGRGRAR